MNFSVIFFAVLSIAFGTPIDESPVAAESHVKSIHIPYRSPVHVTGYTPVTTFLEAPVLKSHSYTTEIRHQAPVAVKSIHTAVPAVQPALAPIKSSAVALPVIEQPIISSVDVAPVPVIVPAVGPVKSSGIKAFSFATEVKHAVPIAAAPLEIQAPVVAEPVVKSIHTPVVERIELPHPPPAVKSIYAPVISQPVIAPAPVVVPAVAVAQPVGPIKSSAVKAFSFATEVRHDVPLAAAVPVVARPAVIAPAAYSPVKSIHSAVITPEVIPHVPAIAQLTKSVHAPVIAPQPILHAPSFAPVEHSPVAVKSIHSPAVHSPAIIPAIREPIVRPYATGIGYGAPAAYRAHAPVLSAAGIMGTGYFHPARLTSAHVQHSAHAPVAVKSIHNPVVPVHSPAIVPAIREPIATPYATGIGYGAPAAYRVHAPVLSAAGIMGTGYFHPARLTSAHVQHSAHAPVAVKSIHSPVVHSSAIVPALGEPIARSYATGIGYGAPAGYRAHALTAAEIIGTGNVYPTHLTRRIPANINFNHRIYGSYPRLYASLAAPGAALWGGQPVSSGAAYMAGVSRGAFGYHPIPVHYQHHNSPVHGVWNYFRG